MNTNNNPNKPIPMNPRPSAAWIVLSINLLTLTHAAWAGNPKVDYPDPKCVTSGNASYSVGAKAAKDMVTAAEGGAEHEAQVFDEAAKEQAENIGESIDCVSKITQAVTPAIPFFGGGAIGSVAQSLTQDLASSACQLVERVTNQAKDKIDLPNRLQRGLEQSLNKTLSGVEQGANQALGRLNNTLNGIEQGADRTLGGLANDMAPLNGIQNQAQRLGNQPSSPPNKGNNNNGSSNENNNGSLFESVTQGLSRLF
ncbi:MAG: hypothetical protein P3W87_006450 [Gammaproteobacteria bacterium]|nr:hypothetical protein [Gammaproteobacteria bacterium]